MTENCQSRLKYQCHHSATVVANVIIIITHYFFKQQQKCRQHGRLNVR